MANKTANPNPAPLRDASTERGGTATRTSGLAMRFPSVPQVRRRAQPRRHVVEKMGGKITHGWYGSGCVLGRRFSRWRSPHHQAPARAARAWWFVVAGHVRPAATK